jgi:Mn2+/Fe2+ NRAMP family transporter
MKKFLEKDINIQSQSVSRKKLQWLKSIGPRLITGASDDDPPVTYSQAGAQFGFGIW